MGSRVRWVWVVGANLALGACAHTAGSASVPDEMLNRVPPDGLAGVHDRQAALGRAQIDLAVKHVDAVAAEEELEHARAEVLTAGVEGAAAWDGNPRRGHLASDQAQELTALRRVAEARVAAGEAQLRLDRQEEQAARARVDLARAQLEWEKYLALQRTGDPDTARLSIVGLRSSVDASESAVMREESEHQSLLDDMSKADQQRRTALDAYDRTRGVGGSGP